MSLKFKLWACAALMVTAVACAASVISAASPRAEPQVADLALADYSYQQEDESVKFILREVDGFIAVYETGAKEPMLVTDIEVITLRNQDRILLEAGIKVSDHEQVLQLLEDLGS